jgi:hypothetical protein
MRRSYPLGSDNLGWSLHYQKLYNQTLRESAAHLAMWYLLLHYMHND